MYLASQELILWPSVSVIAATSVREVPSDSTKTHQSGFLLSFPADPLDAPDEYAQAEHPGAQDNLACTKARSTEPSARPLPAAWFFGLPARATRGTRRPTTRRAAGLESSQELLRARRVRVQVQIVRQEAPGWVSRRRAGSSRRNPSKLSLRGKGRLFVQFSWRCCLNKIVRHPERVSERLPDKPLRVFTDSRR